MDGAARHGREGLEWLRDRIGRQKLPRSIDYERARIDRRPIGGVVISALVRFAHGPLGPRPRPVWAGSPAYPRGLYTTEMPRDPNGKLDKRKLRDPYWADHAG
ncbi:MAG: hypothetical protein F4017_05455 [Acidimicrobiaceae bacterium]|nr:hypothetical protein [Acidimicrobiaceae bacterium]MXZ99361.1 hypothetical protein [Acidimicrobiaceae bacterium]MYK74026.1 hypothetical protein [Acidimicrobiaceae bacterium]